MGKGLKRNRIVASDLASDLDRELCELAGLDVGCWLPSRDWSHLAAVCAAIGDELGGDFFDAVFGSQPASPATAAENLLEAVWDQAVVLPDVGPDE